MVVQLLSKATRSWCPSIVRTTQPRLRIAKSYSTNPKRTPWRQDTTPEPSVFVEENFAKHTLFVLDVAKRAIKFSLIGLFTLAATAATAYEGAHLWVEHRELSPDPDPEVARWQWASTLDRWTGDPVKGGTDQVLGVKGQHVLRSAWMAQNWGVGFSTAVIGGEATNGHEGALPGPGGLNVIDAELQRAEDFLRSAVTIAEHAAIDGKLQPETLAVLLARHANVLERLGPSFWAEAKAKYERAWATLPRNDDLDAAQIASKIGDISARLRQEGEAASWWARAINLVVAGGKNAASEDSSSQVPTAAPAAPLAQRILTSTLVAQSAHLASTGQLKQAQALEEQALALLRSIQPPESFATASPPQALHALFLLQRSSIISVHLAEVLYSLRKPAASSVQWLTSAAGSSERVVRALTGPLLKTSTQKQQQENIPDVTDAPLLQVYSESRSMKKPASALLRDARRTTAEAWNLIGLLKERREPQAALECYERALNWAGAPSKDAGARQAAAGTLHSDWEMFLNNYLRLKRTLHPDTP
ncbi:hypothetical protein BDN72DRAFT_831021 [Pluteus cervinus]|uniref:Uncharacterized protein n=1 Tax=Pluteus cervinus TaxID=181527 RepID=A0ACD3BEU3_9AGAR|nr:hypothetical protein BDN72DRAFT_831021 [Pluteus cervinus]